MLVRFFDDDGTTGTSKICSKDLTQFNLPWLYPLRSAPRLGDKLLEFREEPFLQYMVKGSKDNRLTLLTWCYFFIFYRMIRANRMRCGLAT